MMSAAMAIVPIQIYGVSTDLPVPAPVSVRDPATEAFVEFLCDPLAGIGLRPSQVQLINGDWSFQYELTASLFEGNGTLVRNADRLRFSVRNARNWADWQLVHQTMLRVHNLLSLDPNSVSNLTMQAQFQFPSTADRERFFEEPCARAIYIDSAALWLGVLTNPRLGVRGACPDREQQRGFQRGLYGRGYAVQKQSGLGEFCGIDACNVWCRDERVWN